ncbi:MAG: hypothetical protein Q7O66_13110 [Dehalococcoidia bacterium]|nr:hypothetical protein [Dehalococcoidia bacterium]
MRLDFGSSEEEIREELMAEATKVWGPERAKADGPNIGSTARAIWRLLQHPLDLTDEMPE